LQKAKLGDSVISTLGRNLIFSFCLGLKISRFALNDPAGGGETIMFSVLSLYYSNRRKIMPYIYTNITEFISVY